MQKGVGEKEFFPAAEILKPKGFKERSDILMGEEVAPRKKFIQTHAKNVKNLDI
ncbi:MAG: hypothetical protein M1127_02520 [Patescibacteria group bacterium]|nr:hypothetical protein [Patescibacteria group bacterium]